MIAATIAARIAALGAAYPEAKIISRDGRFRREPQRVPPELLAGFLGTCCSRFLAIRINRFPARDLTIGACYQNRCGISGIFHGEKADLQLFAEIMTLTRNFDE